MSKKVLLSVSNGPRTVKLHWPAKTGAQPNFSFGINNNDGDEKADFNIVGTVGGPEIQPFRIYRIMWDRNASKPTFSFLAPGEGIQGGDPQLLVELNGDLAALM